MEKTVIVGQDQIDALTRQIMDLNKNLKKDHLQQLNTEILDTKGAAEYLKVNIRTIEKLRAAGEIKYSQHGSIIRYRRVDLDRWLKDHEVK